jgi:hypothetical protein
LYIDVVDWDAEAYSHRIPRATSTDMEVNLLERYPPKLYKLKGIKMNIAEIRQQEFGRRFIADHSAPVESISEPAIIFDIFGRILVWNLPGVLSNRFQKGIWSSCALLQGFFRQSYLTVKTKEKKGRKPYWRERGFIEPNDNLITFPGTAIFSPGWFELGHNVISFTYSQYYFANVTSDAIP